MKGLKAVTTTSVTRSSTVRQLRAVRCHLLIATKREHFYLMLHTRNVVLSFPSTIVASIFCQQHCQTTYIVRLNVTSYHFTVCYMSSLIAEYIKYRECFKNGELHEEGQFCNFTFTSRLVNLRNHDCSFSRRRDRTCQ